MLRPMDQNSQIDMPKLIDRLKLNRQTVGTKFTTSVEYIDGEFLANILYTTTRYTIKV